MTKSELAKVRRTAREAQAAQERFVAAIREAHEAGASLRTIAAVTDVSYETIRRLLLKS